MNHIASDIGSDSVMTIMEPIGNSGTETPIRFDLSNSERRQCVLLYEGNALAETDGLSRVMVPGSLLVMPAGSHCSVELAPGACGMWSATLESAIQFTLLPLIGSPSETFWSCYHVPALIDYWTGSEKAEDRLRIIHDLEAARARLGRGCDFAIAAYIFLILFDEPRRLRPGQGLLGVDPTSQSQLALVMRFKGLIETRFREHLPIETFGRLLGVSIARLARACKSIANRSPLDFLQERIFVEARRELAYSERHISEIAYRLGFQEASYFSRRFKQVVGCSPQEFRQQRLPVHQIGHLDPVATGLVRLSDTQE